MIFFLSYRSVGKSVRSFVGENFAFSSLPNLNRGGILHFSTCLRESTALTKVPFNPLVVSCTRHHFSNPSMQLMGSYVFHCEQLELRLGTWIREFNFPVWRKIRKIIVFPSTTHMSAQGLSLNIPCLKGKKNY